MFKRMLIMGMLTMIVAQKIPFPGLFSPEEEFLNSIALAITAIVIATMAVWIGEKIVNIFFPFSPRSVAEMEALRNNKGRSL